MMDLFEAQPLEQPKVESIELDGNVLAGKSHMLLRCSADNLKRFPE